MFFPQVEEQVNRVTSPDIYTSRDAIILAEDMDSLLDKLTKCYEAISCLNCKINCSVIEISFMIGYFVKNWGIFPFEPLLQWFPNCIFSYTWVRLFWFRHSKLKWYQQENTNVIYCIARPYPKISVHFVGRKYGKCTVSKIMYI